MVPPLGTPSASTGGDVMRKSRKTNERVKTVTGLDPVRQHDLWNLVTLPWVALLSSYATWNQDKDVGQLVIKTLICYMIVDALYISLSPKSVPSCPLVLFHHFVSILGLTHGIRHPTTSTNIVAAYGLIEIHTTFMTFRRFTGIRHPFMEFWFHVVTVLIRLVCIPWLVYNGFNDLIGLNIVFKLDGLPPVIAMLGLSAFNIQFLMKRKAMFNYTSQTATKKAR